MKQGYGEAVFFCDEMRYGTRSSHKRRWTRQGRRPRCPIKIGYEWAYLYAAICPHTGELFTMLFPGMKKQAFEAFANALEEHLELPQDKKILLIGDRASIHQKQLMPEQITWQPLPTAAPELNPVERFFEELRKQLANRIFDSLEQVEKALTFLLLQWKNKSNEIIKLTAFPYIRHE